MKRLVLTGLFLCSLFVVGGGAQSTDTTGRPVWALEFIRVTPGNFGPAMSYLDDNWMHVRAEAKRQGAVLDYHRIQNAVVMTPRHQPGEPTSVVLMTEYKNMDAYTGSKKLFDSIQEQLPAKTPGVIKSPTPENLFQTLRTEVFVEEPDTSAGLKLLAKR